MCSFLEIVATFLLQKVMRLRRRRRPLGSSVFSWVLVNHPGKLSNERIRTDGAMEGGGELVPNGFPLLDDLRPGGRSGERLGSCMGAYMGELGGCLS